MGQVKEVLDESMKEYQRITDTEQILNQLRPWLEYRRIAQLKASNNPYGEEVKQLLLKNIEHCDKNIKELLGL